MNYKLSEIASFCGGELSGDDRTVRSVTTDSRSFVAGGDVMFVAMRGVNHDAHDFVQSMYARGVRSFMLERGCELPADCSVVRVENSLAALQALAAERRRVFGGVVVGIAGSNGKTVVKEWAAQCMPSEVKLFRSPRSYNSQLGVALSLLMIDDDAQIAIIEAGISQCGEMERLEAMLRPDVVVYTSIGDAHQENFGSLEQKISEKLLLAVRAEKIIYHSAYKLLAETVVEKYAGRMLADAALESIPTMGDMASERNAQTVKALFSVLGIAAPDLSLVQPVAMRLEVKQGVQDSLVVDDSYNADINSLSIALDHLHSVAFGRRKIVILSDILQSATDDAALYTCVARMVADAGVDLLVGVGPRIATNAHCFGTDSLFYASTDELLARLGELPVAGSAILVKGNRNSRLERVSHRLELRSHTTVLEVNLRAMERNINWFRSHLREGVKLVAMVKASGYGSGEGEVARMLQKQAISYLAVAFADEGVTLRGQGITMPIVVLNADDASFDAMLEHALEPEIYSMRSLDAFVRAVESRGERNWPIHVKLDTGMHRLGFAQVELDALADRLAQYAGAVRVASVFTHLCAADDPSHDDFTRLQIERYERMSSALTARLGYPVMRHAAASAAMLRFPEAQYDACRLGLGLYGFGYRHNNALEMVSTLRTRIVQIRTLAAGESVGYGRAQLLARQSRIATIPIGYADGLDRHLGSGGWSVLVAGKAAPTVGRICMDSCMIDITGIDGVEEGDEVTVFSPVTGNTPEDMARVLDTIPYEVLTSVARRVKRIYIDE